MDALLYLLYPANGLRKPEQVVLAVRKPSGEITLAECFAVEQHSWHTPGKQGPASNTLKRD